MQYFFKFCTDVLVNVADVFGISYRTTNIAIFCVLGPSIFLCSLYLLVNHKTRYPLIIALLGIISLSASFIHYRISFNVFPPAYLFFLVAYICIFILIFRPSLHRSNRSSGIQSIFKKSKK
jgi:hypothetical protein